MDDIDFAIIQKLTEDARISFRKIARDLELSPDTVINRYKKLRQQGIIRGSTIVINPKKIGYEGMAIFLIDISPVSVVATEAKIDSSLILGQLIHMRNIIVATKTVGDHDLLAIGVALNIEHLIQLKNDIAKIPGIKNLEVSFWVEKIELCPKYFIV